MRLIDENIVAGLIRLGDATRVDFLGELITLFRREAPKQLVDILEAVERGDFRTISRLAHKLRSSCNGIGALAMAEKCRELEAEACSGVLENTKDLLQGLEVLLELSHVELERHRLLNYG